MWFIYGFRTHCSPLLAELNIGILSSLNKRSVWLLNIMPSSKTLKGWGVYMWNFSTALFSKKMCIFINMVWHPCNLDEAFKWSSDPHYFNSYLTNNKQWIYKKVFEKIWKTKIGLTETSTNQLIPTRTLGLWYSYIAQLIIQAAFVYRSNHLAIMLHSLLAYCRGWLRVNRCIYQTLMKREHWELNPDLLFVYSILE